MLTLDYLLEQNGQLVTLEPLIQKITATIMLGEKPPQRLFIRMTIRSITTSPQNG